MNKPRAESSNQQRRPGVCAIPREEFNVNDRVSSMPYKHHALAFGFRFDATTRTLVPVTRELLAFEHGIDDTVKFPWVRAGYSTEYVPDNSTDVTNTYEGGSWSRAYPVLLTGITLVFPSIARVVPASDVKHVSIDDKREAFAFPRHGGDVLPDTATVAELQGVLTDALLHGGEARIQPPGNNSWCSLFVGPTRFLRGDDGTIAWRPAGHVLVDPMDAQMRAVDGRPYHPNRIEFVFRENVRSVPWPADLATPAHGDYVVVDFDVRVEVAEIAVSPDGSEYEGMGDIDKRKVAAHLAAFGPEVAGPHAVPKRG